LDNSPTVWFEYAVDLTAGQDIVIDVFHDMVAEYDIKGVGFKRDFVYIHLHLGQRGFNVSGDVFEVFHGFHPVDKAKLWRDMKHFQVGGEEVCLLLQK
jgi:hypothetical protein